MCQAYIIMGMKDKQTSAKVGMNIKLQRVKHKLTQEELAFRAEISTNMLSNIERGIQSPTIETVAAIANALGVELYKLFIFEE